MTSAGRLRKVVIIIAFAAALTLIISAGRGGSDAVQAQLALSPPGNVAMVNAGNSGEVHITWDGVSDSAYYRIGWMAYEDYLRNLAAGEDWRELFTYFDVANRGQAAHTIAGLTPRSRYAVMVGGSGRRYGKPQWPPEAGLQLGAPGTDQAELNSPTMMMDFPAGEVGGVGDTEAVTTVDPSPFSWTLSPFGQEADGKRTSQVSSDAEVTSCQGNLSSLGVKTAELMLTADVTNHDVTSFFGQVDRATMYVIFRLEDQARGLSLEALSDRKGIGIDESEQFSFSLTASSAPPVGWPKAQKEAEAVEDEDVAGQLSLQPLRWFPGVVNLSCEVIHVRGGRPDAPLHALDSSTTITVSEYVPNSDYGKLNICDLMPKEQVPLVQGEGLVLDLMVSGYTKRFYGGVEYWLHHDGERIAHGGRSKQRTSSMATTVTLTGSPGRDRQAAGMYTLDCALWGHMISDAYVPQDNYVAYAEAKEIRENQRAFNELVDQSKKLSDYLDDVVGDGSSDISLDDIFRNIFQAIANVLKAAIDQVYREVGQHLLGQFETVYGNFSDNCDATAYEELDTVEKQFVQNVERNICDYALLSVMSSALEVEVADARWGRLEIGPSRYLPGRGGDRDITVRVYTHESKTSGHERTAPIITAPLPDSLVPPGARIHWPAPTVYECDDVERVGYDEVCWEAVFEDVPDNTARAVQNDQGEITDNNDAQIMVLVNSARDIGGRAPTGSITVSGLSPYSNDREPLRVFYQSAQGQHWVRDDNWDSEEDISEEDIHEWYGVNDWYSLGEAEKTGSRVISLELQRNGLRGNMPEALGYLEALKYLNLRGNTLSDNPGLSDEIPTSLKELVNLQELYLSGNRLSGEIPEELGTLSNLRVLDLSDNLLEGEIPIDLGGLASLEVLELEDNRLTGRIPAELGNLTNLEGLDLADNRLSGAIPARLANLTNLEDLYLSGNRFTGCIPTGLRNLRLHNNDLRDLDVPYCDVALSALTVSPGQLEPAFETHVMKYSVSTVQPRVTITPVNDHGASFTFFVDNLGTRDADPETPGFQLDLGCGDTTVLARVVSADRRKRDTYTIEFQREAGDAPSAPTIVGNLRSGPGSLRANWHRAESNCTGAVKQYNVRYAVDGDDPDWTVKQRLSTSLTYTIRGLTSGATYRVQVQGVSEAGSGPWSETATGIPRTPRTSSRETIEADYIVREGDGQIEIALIATEPPSEPVTFRIRTTEGTANPAEDYLEISYDVTFDANSPLTQTITITIRDNSSIEDTETFDVHLDHISGGPFPPGLNGGRYATVAILDDDPATVGWSLILYNVAENSGSVQICVTVHQPPTTCPVNVPFEVHLSYSDPFGALGPLPPSQSLLPFSRCDRTRCTLVPVNDVDGNTEAVVRITRIVPDFGGSLAVGPSTTTITVFDQDPP